MSIGTILLPSTGPATTVVVGSASYSLSCWSWFCSAGFKLPKRSLWQIQKGPGPAWKQIGNIEQFLNLANSFTAVWTECPLWVISCRSR
jgi:hypothetical protein